MTRDQGGQLPTGRDLGTITANTDAEYAAIRAHVAGLADRAELLAAMGVPE